MPVERVAHEWPSPALTVVAFVIPSTSTGVLENVVVPLPNCPEPFQPQHLTVPLAISAQVEAPPALTAVAPVTPTTSTGIEELLPEVPEPERPLPSAPQEFAPQHFTAPPAMTTHAWSSPVLMAVAPVTPTTSTGVGEPSVFPVPSFPKLLEPQHFTAPPATIAHEKCPPAATAVAPATPTTSTGDVVKPL
jgi:hypothetical protein